MNAQLAHLEYLDRLGTVIQKASQAITPTAAILEEFRLILIEADQMKAAEDVSDILVHLEASREILNKIKFQ